MRAEIGMREREREVYRNICTHSNNRDIALHRESLFKGLKLHVGNYLSFRKRGLQFGV